MLKLYYSPGSAALAPHIVLEEIGAAFEPVRIDFAAGQQRSPEYLAINPKGRVPVLVTDRGILTEAPAILAYLAQVHPQAGLAPSDPFGFARAQAFNSYLCSTVHVAHAHGPRAARWADDPAAQEAMKRKVPQTMTEAFALIEGGMLEGPWVLGADYSICDAYLFTMARWLERDAADLSRLPRVLDHRARMQERPAVRRALELHSR
ncbi:MAG TPA: glutathione S-transferase N-terminal domain-containing protein [Thermohalobaculum sp.]|nr:glutathione S-transferase N-terminal domain-containing protein [Thermohalobaculum sp.]